ncbi:MAG: sigma-70 family RNA polymerase sigma factor [Patescibacteria group bacterium]|nr:sigma-70 family RNA polymerase sigma factor [Patescibacteria group bacterium]MDE1988367.1 sigma-70 family RNA polymerase sigma factor [Patescibacteria group bacterium]MDE2217834.1 sigma-70 family RNA polymerase sigma factor [Patescibacteria group bacterium]
MQRKDQQLIADYLNGDDGAIAVLIDRHLKTVFSFTYRLVRNKENAEDIAQDTFLKMWRNLKKYRPGENFKTWLFTIARNAAIDFLRKKKSLAFSDFEDDDGENAFIETLTDPEPLPDEIFAKAEEENVLDEALNKLSLPHRETLLLRYSERLTFDEIGKILGQSINTVKSRHRRAVENLRRILYDSKLQNARELRNGKI